MGDEGTRRESYTPVQITVFNQTYRVISVDGGERATRVAELVDARMREIAAQITTHEVAKIAIMAALNIADDLLTLREKHERENEVSTATDNGAADQSPGDGGGDAAAPSRISWFETVFDSELGSPANRGERMSSRITERLQSSRQSDGKSPAEDPNPEVGTK